MTVARVLWLLMFAAATAACSGNLGGGQSTLPGTPQTGTNVQQIAPAPATSTPNSASNVASVGETVSAQALPAINGWGGTIAFAKPAAAATASANPSATLSPAEVASGNSTSVGITTSVVEPTDAPHFGSGSSKRRAKADPNTVSSLFFVTLLATSDLTLGEYPKIAFTVPRDIASTYRNDTYALALYDPGQNEKSYRLAVAERDLSSPLPGSIPAAVATPVPTPVPAPTPYGMPNGGAAAFTPPPIGTQLGADALPPEYIAFQATQATLKLKANRPVVFALYAVPPPPSPSPSPSPKRSPSPLPSPSHSLLASPGPTPSPAPDTSGSPAAAPSASTIEATAKPADIR